MPGTGNPYATSDLGRRVAARRALLGLSREEVTERTGSTSGYIAYVEERVSTPGAEFLVRLASALETTVQDLAGYTADLPQGGAAAGRRPRMEEIDEAECWGLLDDHGVGRVALEGQDGPVLFPVNYRVVDREIVFMTAADSALVRASAGGTEIAFEQDRLDEAFSQGWSVLVVGTAREVPTAAEPRGRGRPCGRGPGPGEGGRPS
ncbi:helix-turn-helix domain-containing protein [Streptomyces sp. SP18ES09]|uniref:helix-turn-helix domain-containing protein n=1 Tax=Streptomyces sp. SP18ES09 TaxID=3002532 RepID=UPI002E774DF1|nr:pyridoxamine 5'-phosphate oxidase family protein [Streptomyces sp. SP18ES09]